MDSFDGVFATLSIWMALMRFPGALPLGRTLLDSVLSVAMQNWILESLVDVLMPSADAILRSIEIAAASGVQLSNVFPPGTNLQQILCKLLLKSTCYNFPPFGDEQRVNFQGGVKFNSIEVSAIWG